MKMWDDEAIKMFFDSINGHKYRDLLQFSVLTGARRGEICGLTWDNVDLGDNRISIVKNISQAYSVDRLLDAVEAAYSA